MKMTKNKNTYRRLEALYLRINGKKSEDISEITGFNQSYISQLVSK